MLVYDDGKDLGCEIKLFEYNKWYGVRRKMENVEVVYQGVTLNERRKSK